MLPHLLPQNEQWNPLSLLDVFTMNPYLRACQCDIYVGRYCVAERVIGIFLSATQRRVSHSLSLDSSLSIRNSSAPTWNLTGIARFVSPKHPRAVWQNLYAHTYPRVCRFASRRIEKFRLFILGREKEREKERERKSKVRNIDEQCGWDK